MMRLKMLFFFIPAALVFANGCQNKMDFKPEDPVFKYVIEGRIENEGGSCQVKVSRTKDFDASNAFTGMSGAIVRIDGPAESFVLKESSPGIYENKSKRGVPGQTYRLIVQIEGQEFRAESTMPSPVSILSFTLKTGDYSPSRATPMVRFRDPAGVKNYYWFEGFVNEKIQRNFSLVNDDLMDGMEISDFLVFENRTKDISRNIVKGDQLTAVMHCVEKKVFMYLSGLSGANGSGEGAPASNPQGNISGGALGFFSAHTTYRRTVVVP